MEGEARQKAALNWPFVSPWLPFYLCCVVCCVLWGVVCLFLVPLFLKVDRYGCFGWVLDLAEWVFGGNLSSVREEPGAGLAG